MKVNAAYDQNYGGIRTTVLDDLSYIIWYHAFFGNIYIYIYTYSKNKSEATGPSGKNVSFEWSICYIDDLNIDLKDVSLTN